MAGLLDYLFSGGGNPGLLAGVPAQPFGSGYVNTDSSGVLGAFRQALNQIADPQALRDAYEQQATQRAGMAMLSMLPGGHQAAQQPSSAPSMVLPAPPASPASAPRGIRNNNPLNIEAGSFTQGLPGYAGSDGRFARFDQPQQGIDAASKLLDTYQSKYGLNTVRGIVNRWAPPGENDSGAYVASVAGRLGVDPDQPLTPAQRQPLIMAMGQFENGRSIAMPSQAMGINGIPERPNAQGVYGSDAVLAQPPLSVQRPVQVSQAAAAPQPTVPQMAPPAGSPMTNQPGSGLTLIDSPALQGMPDSVRRAIPFMLQSKTMAPQAMALIQKYINPDQWQMWRDSMGNVFTRNSATGESKPLLTPTPQMMNANASGMRSPLEYETGVAFGQSAAKNTELTGTQKEAGTPAPIAQLKTEEAQATELGKSFAKKYEGAVEGGVIAASTLPKVDMALSIVKNDPNFYSGIGENYNLAVKKIAAALGLPDTGVGQQLVAKTVADQTVNAIRSFAANSPVGRVLQKEVEAIATSLGSNANTPQALGLLLQVQRNVLSTMGAISDIAQTHNGGSGKLDPAYDRAATDYLRTHPVIDAPLMDQIRAATRQPGATQQQPQGRTPNPYEAEMRRRGLLQ